MPAYSRWLPASLARRFALAAAGLAAAALMLTSLASWWLINEQHDHAVSELAARERQFRAAAVGSDLNALATRIAEIAGSTILATGLVDSAGRETYLVPFLGGIRQINGIPVQVIFTDFQGQEIASNSGARFSPEQLAWLSRKLEAGRPAAEVFRSPEGDELVAVEPMVYASTSSPEGAVLYKIALSDIKLAPPMRLEWGVEAGLASPDGASTPVAAPPVFAPLNFRVRGQEGGGGTMQLALPFLHILTITLGLFGVVVFAGVRLARLLTLDLQRLQAFSGRLVGSGLSTERAPEGGSAEVAILARSINDMLDRMTQQHGALLQEREKLTRLTEALQSADRKKDAFLAMLGHELRNPLSPISAGAELLRRIAGDDPRIEKTSQVISRQVGHMTKIINDLLDVSRVTRGLITLDKARIDIADVVSAAVEQVRPLIESRRHRLTVALPPAPALVFADRARLVQVVSNLLTNAAKYTAEGGELAIRAEASDSEVSVSVQDNGVGIAVELMPEIFDLFTQGARAVDRTQGGLGLGLALVKHLVAVHGGTVDASSDGPDRGALFTVRLPRVQALPAAPSHEEPASGAGGGALRIMVVDDNVDAAQALAELLSLEGHSVSIAHDGPSALTLAERVQPEVFVLDIGLPGMDGIELARRLRAQPAAASAMLIALTGYGQAADRQKSAEARFDHHMVKPVDPTALNALIEGWAQERLQNVPVPA
jgi:signal transduction histidine kinase/ActR/RegA family two-component response regulator